ncbi:Predicted PurR-regulated permease PerM [Tindallia magadiensis]|uniref:Predicted PurR-regulated permease PerM n=1 Tax=Tindallia magadiensis TaxID=69895 RepID=A0A1I3CDS7_9FIRM|nr:AI-2E family transporter [Tindallia magadiensis]SFH72533.1 Predicted PurR-regulated permease PerM [Tindallia magadiensis]
MRIKWDHQYLKYTLYASLTIIIAIVFYHVVDNLTIFVDSLRLGFKWLRKLLSPFIIAGFIAYLLNPGVRWFETRFFRRIFGKEKSAKRRRNLSILSVYLIFAGALTALIMIIVPQIIANVRDIARRAPEYAAFIETFINRWSTEFRTIQIYHINIDLYDFAEPIEQNLDRYLDRASEIMEISVALVINRAMAITSGFLNFVLGLVISVYALADKESFKNGTESVLRAFFRKDKVEKIKDFGREADYLFSRFIVGKSIDSLIIGILCYIGMLVMDIRYALLLSVFVGVANMIPYFGPILGMIPAGLLTLIDSPVKAFWVVVFLLALQQFDGLYLGPKILGSSVGMPPFWVIFSIIIGGKLFGVMGMFLGVPVFSVIRLFLRKLFIALIQQKEEEHEHEHS